jgi:hypothetical protein
MEEATSDACHSWEDTIKMYTKIVGCERQHWMQLAQDGIHWQALSNTTINFPVT